MIVNRFKTPFAETIPKGWLKDTYYTRCKLCKTEGSVVYREVDEIHGDTNHWCKQCGKDWYDEGPDY